MKSLRSVVFVVAALCATQANAALMDWEFSFSFFDGGDRTITGVFSGELQADGDTVIVELNSDITASFDGLLFDPLQVVDPEFALTSISGDLLNFCPATSDCAIEGFFVGVDTTAGDVVEGAIDGSNFGGVLDRDSWSLNPVPVPATIALFVLGLLGLRLRQQA